MSKINRNTKISVIIKANPDSIKVIASIAKPFLKLKNPILRRLLAPRVTVSEAASIGGCTIDDFKRVLEPLGFIFDLEQTASIQTGVQVPVWFGLLKPQTTDLFDVRQLITHGDDPLKQIMQRYELLPTGQAICIINSIIPYPLLQVLAKKGAQHYIESIATDLHYTWFFKEKKTQQSAKNENNHIHMMGIANFEKRLTNYHPQQIIVLDVRELPMPLPMETILRATTDLQDRQVLHIYHKRMPLHLMEELEGSDFEIRLCEYAKEDIRLLINHAIR